MSDKEIIARLIVENILLRDENKDLKKRLANSIPVTRNYSLNPIGDLAAILKNVMEANNENQSN